MREGEKDTIPYFTSENDRPKLTEKEIIDLNNSSIEKIAENLYVKSFLLFILSFIEYYKEFCEKRITFEEIINDKNLINLAISFYEESNIELSSNGSIELENLAITLDNLISQLRSDKTIIKYLIRLIESVYNNRMSIPYLTEKYPVLNFSDESINNENFPSDQCIQNFVGIWNRNTSRDIKVTALKSDLSLQKNAIEYFRNEMPITFKASLKNLINATMMLNIKIFGVYNQITQMLNNNRQIEPGKESVIRQINPYLMRVETRNTFSTSTEIISGGNDIISQNEIIQSLAKFGIDIEKTRLNFEKVYRYGLEKINRFADAKNYSFPFPEISRLDFQKWIHEIEQNVSKKEHLKFSLILVDHRFSIIELIEMIKACTEYYIEEKVKVKDIYDKYVGIHLINLTQILPGLKILAPGQIPEEFIIKDDYWRTSEMNNLEERENTHFGVQEQFKALYKNKNIPFLDPTQKSSEIRICYLNADTCEKGNPSDENQIFLDFSKMGLQKLDNEATPHVPLILNYGFHTSDLRLYLTTILFTAPKKEAGTSFNKNRSLIDKHKFEGSMNSSLTVLNLLNEKGQLLGLRPKIKTKIFDPYLVLPTSQHYGRISFECIGKI